jgi:hypothetical protein
VSAIVDFYSGMAKDHAGRKIEEIWMWNDEQLEDVHDYIQWLFPNREPSAFNPHAPLLTDDDVKAFRESSFLHARLLRSFERMCAFYCIGVAPCAYYGVKEGPPYWWDSPRFAHNWLRMTRIMLCTGELGLPDNTAMFHEAVNKASLPDNRTRDFWSKAAGKTT